METKKLFISQPMNGLSNEDIEKERARILEAVKTTEGANIELIDSFFKDAPHDARPLWFPIISFFTHLSIFFILANKEMILLWYLLLLHYL